MTHSNLKRAIAALMVVMMLVGVLPVNVFASRVVVGGDTVPSKPVIEDTEADVELGLDATTDLVKVIEKMESIYVKYLGEENLTTEEINARVSAMDYDTLQAARLENYYLEEMAKGLTEEDIAFITESYVPYIDFASAVESRGQERQLARTNVAIMDGLTFADNQNTGSLSNGTYTATAKGSIISKKTNTITMTNGSGVTKKLTFDYSIAAANSYTGFTGTSGTIDVVLAAGESFTGSVTSNSGFSNTTVTLTITNIKFVDVATSADITVNYNGSMGSVTVNGTAVAAGGTVADVSTSAVASFVAAPASGAVFVAWVDADGKILSTSATYNTTPAGNMTVKALFSNTASAPIWQVSGYAYEDFNTAASKGGTMILMNNATLPAGNYTVPAATTVLIPYNAANTVCTTAPITQEAANFGDVPTISRYRTLYMASGANITVNGAISVSGAQMSGGAIAAAPIGPLGFIEMRSGSSITVNSGAKLYAWGYIIGSGTVTAKSGATVYEDFVVADWRGGSATSSMATDERTFPFNQYYVQNIEVPLTLEAGAAEKGYMSVKITLVGIQGSEVPFIGPSGAMFNITSGSATKYYVGSTDRLVIEVNGNVTVDPLSISMKLGLLGSTTIKSNNFELPFTSNLTADIKSGSISLNQDIAVLPGSQVIVREGAVCTIGTGVSVYVYDRDEWMTNGYSGSRVLKFVPHPNAPGRTYNRTAADLVDALIQVDGVVDASNGYLYSTASGGNVTSTGSGKIITGAPGTKTYTEQAVYIEDSAEYHEIAITPVKLHNADGSYTASGDNKAAGEYNYVNGVWTFTCHHKNTETIPAVNATCTATGLTAGTKCKDCGVVTVEQTVINALGHDIVTDAYVAPTCIATGLEEGSHCSRCNDMTVAQKEIPALGHTEVIDAAVAATCTETGLTAGKHCSVCEEVLVAQTVVDALGHTEVIDAAVAATCTETGLTEGKHCSVCSEVLVAQTVVDALGHDMIVDAAVAATCTEDGIQAGAHCSRCDYSEGRQVIPALGHTEVDDAAVAATCTETGLTAGKHCSVCEEVTVAQTVVDALGHDIVTDAYVAPTCTATGLEEGSHCSRCDGMTVAQKEIPALGHTEANDAAVAPTCTETGLTAGKHCSVCNEVLVAQTVVDALGHTKVFVEEEPAFCEQDGQTEGYYCSVCEEVLSGLEKITALGHNIIQVEAKKPTYSSVGWEAYEKCTRCAYSTYVEIDKLPEPTISTYEEFLENLVLLEELAEQYVIANPGKDPAALVIKYIRTGVEKYNSGSWGIMAGYEDKGFAEYVSMMEDEANATAPSTDVMLKITALKNLREFTMPNGDYYDMEHLFGTLDITYTNKTSQNHADVAGWSGDLVDLIAMTDRQGGFPAGSTFEEKVKFVRENRLGWDVGDISGFGIQDIQGDLDAIHIVADFYASEYEMGTLTQIFTDYFTADLNDVDRAAYFMDNRLNGVSTRIDVRDAVYNAYIKNNVVTTLESTEEITTNDVVTLRKAACYAFADYICELAGDYVENMENDYYSVFSSTTSTLAPGVTQKINYATSSDGKQMVYYLATGDITRDDVNFYVNYNDTYPEHGWKMARVLDQANAAQERYGNPESPDYIENYNVIAATNGAGFNMQTGEPSGLMVMNGVQYQDCNSSGFFGIKKDGTPVVGTKAEYNAMKNEIQEGVSIFGSTLIKDGEIVINRNESYYTERASRTAIGITKTGKIVMMVLDGRQEPFSCGGSMEEIAQIMYDAGCVEAVNLDGGGSSTFVAKQEGDDELSVVNSPSDGLQRSVSTSIMLVSTAPNSTAFDHAVLEAEYGYLTKGASTKLTVTGVSATGNPADLPEGTELVVADPTYGTVTDGVFTAAGKIGAVNVNLVLDGAVLGTVTLNIVTPDNVYYTNSNINTVYGQATDIPVQVAYEGKNIAFTADDIVFTLDNPAAGSINGLVFTGTEGTNVKIVKVTAALAADTSVTATAAFNLFNQGEISFDFDQATGGDRILAWDRQVSNSTTEDDITYNAINIDEDMVTSYIFALDMREIPIPERLMDLTSMLPGSDLEDASAWTFLCNLAERISTLTTVTASITFDSNFDVDYSNLKIVNDYFYLKTVEFDEETNTLTFTVGWIDQTAAINVAMANPIFIVSGIDLTPKDDADWGEKKQLTVVNAGDVSYQIYMRANALYSFATKVDNQGIYGLYPFINPDDENEKGGWFSDTYASLDDSYTLVKSVKEGWVIEDGGFAYYVDGVRYTGIQKVDGYYYDFGENGINEGQTKYTGMVTIDGKTYYCSFGEFVSGWHVINGDNYYFNSNDFTMATGEYKVDGHMYTFNDDGVLVRGAFVKYPGGTRYFWAGRHLVSRWFVLDEGRLYANQQGYVCYGNQPVYNTSEPVVWYHFNETTGVAEYVCNGFIWSEGELYWCNESGNVIYGVVDTGDGFVFCRTLGKVAVNSNCYVSNALESTCGLETGYYYCDENGYIVPTGFVTVSDNVYYMTNYVKAKGLTKIGEDYYFFNLGSGWMYKDSTLWIDGSNAYGLAAGYYSFDADGKMIVPDLENGVKEIVEENGKLYFYIDGVMMKNGLYELDGEYYYATSTGVLATDTVVWVSKTNDLVEKAWYYEFKADGKMVKTGFVAAPNGYTYYYDNTVIQKTGLTKIGDDYYFLNRGNGSVGMNTTLWVEGTNAYGFAAGYYNFNEEGKMIIPDLVNGKKEIIEKDGNFYFYIDGVMMKYGLYELDGEYYYATSTGVLATDTVVWVSQTNDLVEKAWYYEFKADGKMVKTGFVAAPNGYTYYYDNTVIQKTGLTKIGDDYYYLNTGSGWLYKDADVWVSAGNNYGFAAGYYTFQSDGTMYIPDLENGKKDVISKDGKLYFTIDGAIQKSGLYELDGEYYYATSTGVLATNTVVWVSQTNDLVEKAWYYEFGADGKMVQTGFVAAPNGYTYYYKGAVIQKTGLTLIDGDYYFLNTSSGWMYVDSRLWVGSNSYGIKSGYYEFGSDGKMILA